MGARTRNEWPSVLLLGLLMGSLAACQSTGRLAEYDFAGSTVVAVYDFPPYPEVLTGPYFPGHPSDPMHAFLRLTSRIATELSAAEIRGKLDEAATMVDVPELVTQRAGERVARVLRARLVTDEQQADFVFEVRIRDYGIDAQEWNSAAHFFVDAEVLVIDAVDGSEIWETHVREREAIAPHIFGGRRARTVRNVVTAIALIEMDEDEIAVALEQLAYYAADRISERLRDSVEESRRN